MLVHILHNKANKFLCGLPSPPNQSFTVWKPDKAEWSYLKPTCEACILLHWVDSSNTYVYGEVNGNYYTYRS